MSNAASDAYSGRARAARAARDARAVRVVRGMDYQRKRVILASSTVIAYTVLSKIR